MPSSVHDVLTPPANSLKASVDTLAAACSAAATSVEQALGTTHPVSQQVRAVSDLAASVRTQAGSLRDLIDDIPPDVLKPGARSFDP